MLCYIIAMNAAHHHDHAPKLSRNQSEILSCLRKAGEPMSAYAILDRVRKSGISHPPTVYRALNDLMQKGMVHRLESRSAFIACGHGACDGKFAFAICRVCEQVIEIPLSDEDRATLPKHKDRSGWSRKQPESGTVTLRQSQKRARADLRCCSCRCRCGWAWQPSRRRSYGPQCCGRYADHVTASGTGHRLSRPDTRL